MASDATPEKVDKAKEDKPKALNALQTEAQEASGAKKEAADPKAGSGGGTETASSGDGGSNGQKAAGDGKAGTAETPANNGDGQRDADEGGSENPAEAAREKFAQEALKEMERLYKAGREMTKGIMGIGIPLPAFGKALTFPNLDGFRDHKDGIAPGRDLFPAKREGGNPEVKVTAGGETNEVADAAVAAAANPEKAAAVENGEISEDGKPVVAPEKAADAVPESADAAAVKAEAVEDPNKAAAAAAPASSNWWSGMYEGATMVAGYGAKAARSAYRAVTGALYGDALSQEKATVSEDLKKLQESGGAKITVGKDDSGDVKAVLAQTTDAVTYSDKTHTRVDTTNGLTITRDRLNNYTKIEKEDGSVLEKFKDGSAKVTQANGDQILRINDDKVQITTKDGVVTTVEGDQVVRQFGSLNLIERAEDIRGRFFRGKHEKPDPKDPKPGECVVAQDATVCRVDADTAIMTTNSGENFIQSKDQFFGVNSDSQVIRVDATGKPIEGAPPVTQAEIKDVGKKIEIRNDGGNISLASRDGAFALTRNPVTGAIEITGRNGEKAAITTTPEGKRHTVITDPAGKPVHDSTTEQDANGKYVVEQKSPTEDDPNHVIRTSFDDQGRAQTSGVNSDGSRDWTLNATGSNLGDVNIDSEGSVYSFNADGSRRTYIDSSDEAFASSTSAASTASSHGSSVATTVMAAAGGSGSGSSEAYRGLAYSALGSVDSAIAQCMTSENWSALGNLIATKDRLITAIAQISEQGVKLGAAHAAGLSGDQALTYANDKGQHNDPGALIRMREMQDDRMVKHTRRSW